MAMIMCPECGKMFSNMAKACPNCGLPTQEVNTIKVNTIKEKNAAFCPKCGKKLEAGARFCMGCGASVITETIKKKMWSIALTVERN